MFLIEDKRSRLALTYSFVFHLFIIWVLSFFIIIKPQIEKRYISVGFVKEEYLPQPLKVSSMKRDSKILGIPESSVILSDMQFREYDLVVLPESRTFDEDYFDPYSVQKDLFRKHFDLQGSSDRPQKGNSELSRDNIESLFPELITHDFPITGDGTGADDSFIRISGVELEKRKIINRPGIPQDIKLTENITIELDFEVTPDGNPVNISPAIIGDHKLLELSISLIQQFRWEKVEGDKNVKGKAVIIFKMK
ncbi:MAG TPA: hypothetical protein ENN73_06515 [Firmicutes bacterium]|nr:hypothetical protein [Bacillota bacterium]